jgi:uncharacterized protein YndB with AHSA1/START domain
MSKPDYVYVIYIQAAPEKIWQALTDGEITREYWGRLRVVSDWTPGSPWHHESDVDAAEIEVAGTVIDSQPPNRLVLSWSKPGNSDPDKISRVSFAIDEFMGSSRLTVTHSELTADTLAKISAGWPAILSSLKSLLETGASLPMTRQRWNKPS